MAGEETNRRAVIPPRRLWFGFSASAIAWGSLGVIDILILWRACTHYGEFGLPVSHPGARILYVIVSVALLATAVAAGVTSWRNWRALSSKSRLLDAEGVDRREFMALVGIFVSITMGMGILWLTLPPFIIELCGRAR